MVVRHVKIFFSNLYLHKYVQNFFFFVENSNVLSITIKCSKIQVHTDRNDN
jgi:hypothetical protein